MKWSIPKKSRRKYIRTDGTKLPSVTEILGSLGWNREVLMGWANKIGRQGFTVAEVRNPKADAGSLAHHLIECDLTNICWEETQEWCESAADLQEKALLARESFNAWWKVKEREGWELVDAEVQMASDQLDYGGTFDLMLRDPSGELVIADIKTGSPHAEAAIQLAAYGQLWEDRGESFPSYGLILHVPCSDELPLTAHYVSQVNLRKGLEIFNALCSIAVHKKDFAALGKKLYADTPKPAPEKKEAPF